MDTIPVTSDVDGETIVFDAPYTEANDHDDTHLVYEMLVKAVGN